MDFGLLPPEVNSGLMYSGPGSGPMLAAAAGWEEVAAELEAAAGGYGAQTGELAQVWAGPSSLAMSDAAAPYVGWLQASSAAAAQTAAQAYSAAAAYEAAFAMTVPPPLIAANRAQLMVLVATNWLGQNTGAIAATEAEYTQMWIQDATAMYGYAIEAETVTTLEPFDDAPQTTNPNGQPDQTAAVARATADTTSSDTQAITQLATSAADDNPWIIGPGQRGFVEGGETMTVGPGGTYTSITIENGGSLTVSGALNVNAGGTLTNNGYLQFVGILNINAGGTLINNGNELVAYGGTLNITAGGTVINAGHITNGGVINVGGTLNIVGGGTLSDAYPLGTGALNVTTGGALNNAGVITEYGTLAVGKGGTLTVVYGGRVDLYGVLNIDGGTVFVQLGGNIPVMNFGTPDTGLVVLGPGEVVTVGPYGHYGPSGIYNTVTVAPAVVPPPPAPMAAPTGLGALLASPGLAGTSGIQPQFNLEALQGALWDGLASID
jgi:PPE-repeat protein